MAFGVQSIDRQTLKNNVVGLAKAAKIFNVPTTITTVETQSFSGNTFPELLAVFPENDLLERTSMNSWDDQNVRDALAKNAANGRKKIVVSGHNIGERSDAESKGKTILAWNLRLTRVK